MALELTSHEFGTHFSELPHPERLAVIRYVDELSQRFPDISTDITAGPGNEGSVYVYASIPEDEDQDIDIHEGMAEVAVDILLSSGISITLMPGPE